MGGRVGDGVRGRQDGVRRGRPGVPPPSPSADPSDLHAEHERVKIEDRRLRIAQRRGDLVEWRPFRREVFELVRRERDAWLTWPARIATGLAARLGTDLGPLQIALEEEVRAQLRDLAQRLPVEASDLGRVAEADGAGNPG